MLCTEEEDEESLIVTCDDIVLLRDANGSLNPRVVGAVARARKNNKTWTADIVVWQRVHGEEV